MKNKLQIIFIILLISSIIYSLFIFGKRLEKKKIIFQRDNKHSILLKDRGLDAQAKSKQVGISDRISQAWDYIEKGNLYFKGGQYEQAAQAFAKAYEEPMGSQALSGFKLAESYEKLGRYDDAIVQLNQMIEKRQLSELGIQDAKELITRLLAAKAKADNENKP